MDGKVPFSAQTVVSSENLNATQELVVAVVTAQDSVETTPKDGESGLRVEDRRSDVSDVWARVGDVEDHSAVVPTLLDSLAKDLLEAPPYANLGDIGRLGVQIPRGSDAADECSSASSESCWGEMEDVGD